MKPITPRQRRRINLIKRRLQRAGLTVASMLVAAVLVVGGLTAGAVVATAAPRLLASETGNPNADLDFGDYAGPRIVQVASGSDRYVIALDEDGGLWGWGLNGQRQVTGTTTAHQIAPVQLTAVTDVLDDDETIVQVTASYGTSLALTSTGRVVSWGYDYYGTQGRNTPATVPGFVETESGEQLTGITKIDAGRYSVLALDADQRVWAWGYNGYGQLGLGTTATKHRAVQVPGLEQVTDISIGNAHSLAIADGVLKAWGYNAGNLGVGTGASQVRTPTDVVLNPAMTAPIVSVEAGMGGSANSLAVDADGGVWSWGYQGNNALGRDGDRTIPGRVVDADGEPLTGVEQVTAGDYNGYALVDGTVYAWGYNNAGRLGVGGTANVRYATPVANFDLGGAIGGVESIAAGWGHLAIVSTIGDDEGVVSIAGQYWANGLVRVSGTNDTVNRDVPTLVWRFEQAFKPFPTELIPRNGEATQTAGATGFPTGPQQLLPEGEGTFNYGVGPFELAQTTDGPTPEASGAVQFRLTSYCSLNATTNIVTVLRGGAYTCNIVRSFDGSSFVAPLPQESWRVYPGRMAQDIASLTDGPGGILADLNPESAPVALPTHTDEPAKQAALRYIVDPSSADVCAITYANGSSADGARTNTQRFITVLGEGDCILTVDQGGHAYYYEPMEKTVEFAVEPGRGPQTLDLSGLSGIRFAQPDPTFDLPEQTDRGEDVAYTVVWGDCTVSGTTLTATGAGDCVVTATAPGKAGDADTGYLPYTQTHTIAIGKGIQTLGSIAPHLATLISANSTSAVLPATSNQGIALTWAAETASPEFPDACSVVDGAVQAGPDVEEDLGDGVMAYAECAITATNAGNDDWEAFSVSSTVEISDRDVQTLDLRDLDGRSVGDTVELPEETDQGQAVTYSATGGCEVDGGSVTFTSGDPCVVTATADGTTSSTHPDAETWYRPFSTTVSSPVSTLAQHLTGMPALAGLAVGSTSGKLTSETAEGQPLTWSAGPADVCSIVNGRVVLTGDGECTVTGTAPGTAQYSPFESSESFTGVANTSALEDALAHALPDSVAGDFTESSWEAYQAALQAARDLLDGSPTQAQVDAALDALQEALDALVDLSELRAVVGDALTDEESYTPDTWSDYAAALADARTVLADPDATEEEVEAALEALVEAEEALVHRADFSALEQAIDAVESLPANGSDDGEFDYDAHAGLEDAYEALQAALEEAKPVYDDKNSSQDAVDDATESLQADFAQLESAMALADLLDRTAELALVETDYTSDTWAALQDALAAAEAALNSTPLPDAATLDDLRADILTAVDDLEYRPQTIPGYEETVAEAHAVGDEPVALPTTTDRGAPVTYTVDPVSAEICELVEGALVFHGIGDCVLDWSAPAVGPFEAIAGSDTLEVGAGLQLLFEGLQIGDGAKFSVGETLTARGEGLEPGTTLRVELHSDPVLLGTATVDADGTASVTFTIPEDTPVGNHTIRATAVSGVDQSTLTRSVGVTVQRMAASGRDLLPVAAGALLLLAVGGGLLLTRRRSAPAGR